MRFAVLIVALAAGCGHTSPTTDDAQPGDAAVIPCSGTPTECAMMWEQNASDRFDAVLTDPSDR